MSKKNGAQKPLTKAQKRAQAAAQAREDAERAENARKSSQMSRGFLFVVLGILAVFCGYTLLRTLWFPAKSLSVLREDLLLVSVVSIPYLIGTLAWLLRRLTAKRRAELSDRGRRAHTILYVVVLTAAFLMCSTQLFRGRGDASQLPAYRAAVSALEACGQAPENLDESGPLGFRTLLEYSHQSRLRWGETQVTLNYHEGALVAGKLQTQLERDYGAQSVTRAQREGVSLALWPPVEGAEAPKAAILARRGGTVTILELSGPAPELDRIFQTLAETALQVTK